MLKNEIVSKGIIGQTKSSKSTLMIWLGNLISKKYFNKEWTINQIFADQFEFGRKVTDHNLHHCIIGIDEYGAMEETGANATIEAKHLEQFSDLQAQREIHRIGCSPRHIMDKNATVILKIVSKDPEEFKTHALVYYKIEAPDMWYTQLIGRVEFCIKDAMFSNESWKKFLNDYKKEYPEYKKFKQKNNQKATINGFWQYICDKHKLTEEQKWKYYNKLYADYRNRKFKKMDLMNKEGIMHMRELIFADIILKVYNQLKGFAGIVNINKDMIEGKINMELKKIRYPLTIYAMEVIKSRINGLITQKKTIERLRYETFKKKNSIALKTKIDYEIKELEKGLQEEEKELNHLIEIAKIYNTIGEEKK